jgi:hypothetical protein
VKDASQVACPSDPLKFELNSFHPLAANPPSANPPFQNRPLRALSGFLSARQTVQDASTVACQSHALKLQLNRFHPVDSNPPSANPPFQNRPLRALSGFLSARQTVQDASAVACQSNSPKLQLNRFHPLDANPPSANPPFRIVLTKP